MRDVPRLPRLTARQKSVVITRANGCCEYCKSQEQYSPSPFSVEHILPRVSGGVASLDNLAFSCAGCNSHKYSKTEGLDVGRGEMVFLFHPRRQQWSHHFEWDEDFSLMIGLTPTGRATLATLYLNRPNLVNLRRILVLIGQHPPDSN